MICGRSGELSRPLFSRRCYHAGISSEQLGSFAVGAVVLAVIVLIVMKLVRDKKAGRYTCGGNCGSCGACSGHCAGCQECSHAAPAKPAEKKK